MKLVEYLPEVIKNIPEMVEIMRVVDIEFLWKMIAKILDDGFVYTLDSEGCRRWEGMLQIRAKDTDTLEERRLRILTALAGDTPYTMRSLERMLETICGKGNYTISYADDEYTLDVGIALESKSQYNYVVEYIKRIIPANIIFNCRLLYNRHIDLEPFTHEKLEKFSHIELCEEVIR